MRGARWRARNAPTAEPTLRELQEAASTIGLQIQILNATTIGEIDTVFDTFARGRPDLSSSAAIHSSPAAAGTLSP
jgi:hypothetical protein